MSKNRFFNFSKCTAPISNRKETEIRIIGVGYTDLKSSKAETHRRMQQYFTIHFVISGRGYLEFCDKKYKIGANQIFALPNKIPFRYYPDSHDPWEYVFFEFDGSLSAEYLAETGFSNSSPVQNCEQPQDLLLTFYDFFEKLNATHVVSYHETVSVFSKILGSFSQSKSKRFTQDDSFISCIKSFIKTRFSDPSFSVEYIAKEFNISHSYLCKIFKKHVGVPIITYISNYKMNYAENLLLNTNFSIFEISYMSGFNNYPHFLTIFKQKHNGVTALNYRKNNRQQ